MVLVRRAVLKRSAIKGYCSDLLKIFRAGLVSISPVAGGWVFPPQPCVRAGHVRPDPKEALARRVIMVAWMIAGALEAKGCVAKHPFNDGMLRIHLSDRDKGQE